MTMITGNLLARLALALACGGLSSLALAAADVSATAEAPVAADAQDAADAATTKDSEEPADVTKPSEPTDAEVAAAMSAKARRRHSLSPLDRRVSLLTRELSLSVAQQMQVKKVLEAQREQVAAVWDETQTPAARRVSATQAIGDRTAEQIRALLTDEQRKKYIQARQRDVAVGTPGGDVETYMKSDKRK